jgi:hypothetical protein
LFLALVSFFINIGINLNVIFSGTSDLWNMSSKVMF